MANLQFYENITIPQGSTFRHAWQLFDEETGQPLDLTDPNLSVRCEVRDRHGGTLITRFHSDPAKGWDGTVEIDNNGNARLVLDSTKTTALTPVSRGGHVYDVELVDAATTPATVTRIVEGRCLVTPEVTSGS